MAGWENAVQDDGDVGEEFRDHIECTCGTKLGVSIKNTKKDEGKVNTNPIQYRGQIQYLRLALCPDAD